METKTVKVVRGLPGSGKSTTVNEFAEQAKADGKSVAIHSTDNYFMVEGEYVFDPSKLGLYHRLNRESFKNSLDEDSNLVVCDNTNTTWKEMKDYVQLAYEYGYTVDIVQPETEWAFDVDECAKRNTHGVPKEAIQRMHDRFQSHEHITDMMAEEWLKILKRK